ncbi:HNH endonuclease [Clostridium felsineum]|uniref:HNH endonuclease n=1 Tax=Clostridium felsineum TaxID=36839 RepID=UPI001FA89449|nr:HNH endonuclease [Clostridium felsineum]
MVHKLIMAAFVGAPPSGICVCHNNGIASDNRLCNLRYDSQHENILDVYRLGRAWRSLTVDDVESIRFGLWCGISCKELGLMFGVAHQTISKIKQGRTFVWLK